MLLQNGAKVGNGNDIDMRMMVHESLAGCIIGKGGQKIKEIREVMYMNFLTLYIFLFVHLFNIC